MKNIILIFVRILFLSLFVMLIPKVVFAEQNDGVEFNGYYVTPSIVNLEGKQGETIRHFITVRNETDQNVQLLSAFKDFEKKGDKLIYKDNVPLEWSVAKWSSIKAENKDINPKTTFDIPFAVNIPKTAELGEHVGLLSLQFMGGGEVNQGKNVTTELLPAIFIIVTDKNGNTYINEKWKLLDYKIDRFNGGDITFHVKNTGDVHLESVGSIKLKNLFTGKQKTIQIPTVNLLRDAEKNITVSWKPDQMFAIYNVELTFSMDGKRFETIETTFFNIPWGIAIVLVVIVLILVGLPIWVFRLRKQLQRIEKRTSNE